MSDQLGTNLRGEFMTYANKVMRKHPEANKFITLIIDAFPRTRHNRIGFATDAIVRSALYATTLGERLDNVMHTAIVGAFGYDAQMSSLLVAAADLARVYRNNSREASETAWTRAPGLPTVLFFSARIELRMPVDHVKLGPDLPEMK